MPMAVPFGSLRVPQPDFSATSSNDRRAYGRRYTASSFSPGVRRVSPSRSSRNCSGSLPAACASSSMKRLHDERIANWLPGARSAPVFRTAAASRKNTSRNSERSRKEIPLAG